MCPAGARGRSVFTAWRGEQQLGLQGECGFTGLTWELKARGHPAGAGRLRGALRRTLDLPANTPMAFYPSPLLLCDI